MKFFTLLFIFFYASSQAQFADCSFCDKNEITITDHKSLTELSFMKNEIYARKGYIFSNPQIQDYYIQQPWYSAINNNQSLILSPIEQKNVDLLLEKINLIKKKENSKHLFLSKKETNTIFTKEKLTQLGLDIPIHKVYHYNDLSGTNYLVLMEKINRIDDRDTLHSAIKAVSFNVKNNNWIKNFELNDLIKGLEEDVHFYTRYIITEDWNGDGLTDPIIIYGDYGGAYCCTMTKILIYHKNKKTAIRIEKGGLDFDRYIQIDSDFYSLPSSIQKKVIEQLELMDIHKHIKFPPYYKSKVEKDKTLLIKG